MIVRTRGDADTWHPAQAPWHVKKSDMGETLPTLVARCSYRLLVRGKAQYAWTCGKSCFYLGIGTVQVYHPYYGSIGPCCAKDGLWDMVIARWPEFKTYQGEPYDPEALPENVKAREASVRMFKHAMTDTPSPRVNGLLRLDGS